MRSRYSSSLRRPILYVREGIPLLGIDNISIHLRALSGLSLIRQRSFERLIPNQATLPSLGDLYLCVPRREAPLENDNTSICLSIFLRALLGSSLIRQLSFERLIPHEATATPQGSSPVEQLPSERFILNPATIVHKVHPQLGYCLCLCVLRREALTRES